MWTVWSHLCKVQKQAKVINGNWCQSSGYFWRSIMTGKEHGTEFWGAGNSLFLDLDSSYTHMFTLWELSPTLTICCFFLCICYKKKKLEKIKWSDITPKCKVELRSDPNAMFLEQYKKLNVVYILDNVKIFILFFFFLRYNDMFFRENILISLRGKLRWLWIQCYDIYNVLSNGSVKQIYI